jgi:hypothetical protein
MKEDVGNTGQRSVEEEVLPTGGLGTEIASLFAEVGLEAEIPELSGYTVVHFDRKQ